MPLVAIIRPSCHANPLQLGRSVHRYELDRLTHRAIWGASRAAGRLERGARDAALAGDATSVASAISAVPLRPRAARDRRVLPAGSVHGGGGLPTGCGVDAPGGWNALSYPDHAAGARRRADRPR